jgi:hypothetical protein
MVWFGLVGNFSVKIISFLKVLGETLRLVVLALVGISNAINTRFAFHVPRMSSFTQCGHNDLNNSNYSHYKSFI